MSRERLLQRRYSETIDVRCNGISYVVTYGLYPDGRIGEVFMGMAKAAGTGADTNARDVAVLISLCLQHGVSLQNMLDATTKRADGEPEELAGVVVQKLIDRQAELARLG